MRASQKGPNEHSCFGIWRLGSISAVVTLLIALLDALALGKVGALFNCAAIAVDGTRGSGTVRSRTTTKE
jgi:hypothetical protein